MPASRRHPGNPAAPAAPAPQPPVREPNPSSSRPLSRRTFLKAGRHRRRGRRGRPVDDRDPARRARAAETPIEHIVISCQENRSFDHYFGYAPQVQAAGFGPPPGYSQPDGARAVRSRRTASPSSRRPTSPHDWGSVHGQWDGGAMDGFMTHSGESRDGLLHRRGAAVLLQPVRDSTLCANFFCSLLGPDLAEPLLPDGRHVGRDHDERPVGLRDLRLPDDPRPARRRRRDLEDLQHRLGQRALRQHRQRRRVLEELRPRPADARQQGRLPQRLPQGPRCRRCRSSSRATPAAGTSIRRPTSGSGWASRRSCVTALRDSPLWDSSAFLLTYDEHGGYFDHVAAAAGRRVRARHPRPDAGSISPYAKPGHLEPTVYELASILKFIERNFGLPTLASVNHRFDPATPVGGNYQAAAPGAPRAAGAAARRPIGASAT